MKNFRQVKEQQEDSFGRPIAQSASYDHWQGDQSHHYAANRTSSLREENAFDASVSQGPPPSFLIQMPLGTSQEDTVEFMSRAKIPVRRQHDGYPSNSLQSHRPFEQTNQASQTLTQNTRQPKRTEEFDRGADKNGMVHRWIYEEVRLSMSKMSILSTVLGLLFLGILFFIIGFLVAVSTLKTEENHDSQSAWKTSNALAEQEGGKKKVGLGAIAGRVAEGYVGGAVSKQFAPLGKAFGATTAIVPGPLQPFARYGIGSAHREVHSVNRAVNPFATRRGVPQEQQQYGGNSQQSQGMPQQYVVQGQGYAPPATYPAGGYQQPVAMQGGYAQGYPPPQQPLQQPMMQQPYYQQPQQPYNQQPGQQQYMASQQMMLPQQAQMVSQQMMQQPQYQQQMVPQSGYYR